MADLEQKKQSENLTLADQATLSLLIALEGGEAATQRSLAVRIGVALGMTNSLLKRAVRKGLVKVSEAPAKRFAYYVTRKGFYEKASLVADYLSSSLTFFRKARAEYMDVYTQVSNRNCKKVALYGCGELAEISFLSAQEAEVDLYCIIQPEAFTGVSLSMFNKIKKIDQVDLAADENVDAVVIADAKAPQNAYAILRKHFDDDQIFTASFLHVNRKKNEGVKDA